MLRNTKNDPSISDGDRVRREDDARGDSRLAAASGLTQPNDNNPVQLTGGQTDVSKGFQPKKALIQLDTLPRDAIHMLSGIESLYQLVCFDYTTEWYVIPKSENLLRYTNEYERELAIDAMAQKACQTYGFYKPVEKYEFNEMADKAFIRSVKPGQSGLDLRPLLGDNDHFFNMYAGLVRVAKQTKFDNWTNDTTVYVTEKDRVLFTARGAYAVSQLEPLDMERVAKVAAAISTEQTQYAPDPKVFDPMVLTRNWYVQVWDEHVISIARGPTLNAAWSQFAVTLASSVTAQFEDANRKTLEAITGAGESLTVPTDLSLNFTASGAATFLQRLLVCATHGKTYFTLRAPKRDMSRTDMLNFLILRMFPVQYFRIGDLREWCNWFAYTCIATMRFSEFIKYSAIRDYIEKNALTYQEMVAGDHNYLFDFVSRGWITGFWGIRDWTDWSYADRIVRQNQPIADLIGASPMEWREPYTPGSLAQKWNSAITAINELPRACFSGTIEALKGSLSKVHVDEWLDRLVNRCAENMLAPWSDIDSLQTWRHRSVGDYVSYAKFDYEPIDALSFLALTKPATVRMDFDLSVPIAIRVQFLYLTDVIGRYQVYEDNKQRVKDYYLPEFRSSVMKQRAIKAASPDCTLKKILIDAANTPALYSIELEWGAPVKSHYLTYYKTIRPMFEDLDIPFVYYCESGLPTMEHDNVLDMDAVTVSCRDIMELTEVRFNAMIGTSRYKEEVERGTIFKIVANFPLEIKFTQDPKDFDGLSRVQPCDLSYLGSVELSRSFVRRRTITYLRWIKELRGRPKLKPTRMQTVALHKMPDIIIKSPALVSDQFTYVTERQPLELFHFQDLLVRYDHSEMPVNASLLVEGSTGNDYYVPT